MLPHQDVRRKVRLASLLIKEVMRRQQENQELSPDHSPQPDENKEYDEKREGEGGIYPLNLGVGPGYETHPAHPVWFTWQQQPGSHHRMELHLKARPRG